jgi:DNA-binding NtrC family response regulator
MKILVVDDEKSQLDILSDILCDAGYEVTIANSGEAAINLLSEDEFPLVLTDLKMPGKDGKDVLEYSLHLRPETQVILMTAFGSIPSAVNAIKSGAYDYLTKPFQKDKLLKVISHAADKVKLIIENRRLKETISDRYGYHNIIGSSKKMKQVFNLLDRIKDIDATVLITGESGTGKEMIAKAIHCSGNRKDGPFVAVNCGAIPEALIESELFGHEKGSFTGATRRHFGKFEQAQKGTIFLDEISTMSKQLQVRLLRVLQEKRIERVGSSDSIELDVRVIVATNDNMELKVQQNEFRADLYHRINVFNLSLPALRERKEDIPLLAKHFFQKFCQQYEKKVPTFTADALSKLENYHFPGNVRELENIIEKTVILCDKDVITADDLMFTGGLQLLDQTDSSSQTLPEKEFNMIRTALKTANGSVKNASHLLGISYKTLQYRMKKFGLNKQDFKN